MAPEPPRKPAEVPARGRGKAWETQLSPSPRSVLLGLPWKVTSLSSGLWLSWLACPEPSRRSPGS